MLLPNGNHLLENFRNQLEQQGCEPKRRGNGFQSRCPAHNDRKPSLSVDPGHDGRVLVNCHAGCPTESVVSAVGLQMSDLMPPADSQFAKPAGPQAVSPVKPGVREVSDKAFPTSTADRYTDPVSAARWAVRRWGTESARYEYHNAAGEVVGWVLRWNLESGKRILPISRHRYDNQGNNTAKWVWMVTGMPAPRPLYRLPSLPAAEASADDLRGRVFIAEGEKAADFLVGIGLNATTSAHGSNSASKTDWTPLAGRRCVLWPDNDAAGMKYAEGVANLLQSLDPPAEVSWCVPSELPSGVAMPEGGDAVEWITDSAATKTATELRELIRQQIEPVKEPERASEAAPKVEPPEVDITNAEPLDGVSLDGERGTPFTPFPLDCFPEAMRDYVRDSAKSIGCDASFVALPMLAAAASAIGNSRRLELKRGWTEPAILWTVYVGNSGAQKSPPRDYALAPLRRIQRRALAEHEQALEEYYREKVVYKRDLAAWRRNSLGDMPPTPPTPPIAERYLSDDATIEALAVLLSDQPRGLLMAPDELAGWFGSFDRYSGGGGDVARWLEMFGGRPMMIDRKTGDNRAINVSRAAVSVTGGIQLDALRRSLSPQYFANGLAARLLLACPPPQTRRWTEVELSDRTESRLHALFARLLTLDLPTHNGELTPRTVRLSPEAKQVWIEFYNRHAEQQEGLREDLSAAWSKLEGYAARLALVLHYAKWASTPAADDEDAAEGAAEGAADGDAELAPVDAQSMRAGVKLSEWFGAEARRIYDLLNESPQQTERRQLLELLDRLPVGLSPHELVRKSNSLHNAAEAEVALNELMQLGLGTWRIKKPQAAGGRPSRKFYLHPKNPATKSA